MWSTPSIQISKILVTTSSRQHVFFSSYLNLNLKATIQSIFLNKKAGEAEKTSPPISLEVVYSSQHVTPRFVFVFHQNLSKRYLLCGIKEKKSGAHRLRMFFY